MMRFSSEEGKVRRGSKGAPPKKVNVDVAVGADVVPIGNWVRSVRDAGKIDWERFCEDDGVGHVENVEVVELCKQRWSGKGEDERPLEVVAGVVKAVVCVGARGSGEKAVFGVGITGPLRILPNATSYGERVGERWRWWEWWWWRWVTNRRARKNSASVSESRSWHGRLMVRPVVASAGRFG
jgi:hypothetical protein